MIRIVSDQVVFNTELDRLEAMPTPGMLAHLDGVLADVLSQTIADVHVITGNLKASAEGSTRVEGGQWEGRISYGGGIVDYAIYERARGGDHDFMRAAEMSGAEFERALEDGLS